MPFMMEPLPNSFRTEATLQLFSTTRLFGPAASSLLLATAMERSSRRQEKSTINTQEACRSVSMSSGTLSRTSSEGDLQKMRMVKKKD